MRCASVPECGVLQQPWSSAAGSFVPYSTCGQRNYSTVCPALGANTVSNHSGLHGALCHAAPLHIAACFWLGHVS